MLRSVQLTKTVCVAWIAAAVGISVEMASSKSTNKWNTIRSPLKKKKKWFLCPHQNIFKQDISLQSSFGVYFEYSWCVDVQQIKILFNVIVIFLLFV